MDEAHPTNVKGGPDSCLALSRVQEDVDTLMADLLDAALAVKDEQGISDHAEAFDYMVSFLSGAYRAMAMTVREPTVEAMHA